jgi:hypothetical protein
MDQLVTEEVAAPGGDSVEEMDTPEAVAEEVSTLDEMYPDEEAPEEGSEVDPDAEIPEGEEGEPEEPAIDPPHSWKAEDKAKWSALPREAQEIIARRETEVARMITAKSEEAKTARETVVEQAKTEIAEFRKAQAAQIRQYAALFTPQPPDERLLYTGDPNDAVTYQQQQAAFLRAHAQQQQLQQAAEFEEAQAQQIWDEQTKAARAADEAKLRDQWPEWFAEGEEGRKLQEGLKSIALEVGYPAELWEERNAADVLALRKVADWKAKAAKWDSYDRNRRQANGQFKTQRQLPPVTRPGTSGVRPASAADPVKLLYPND